MSRTIGYLVVLTSLLASCSGGDDDGDSNGGDECDRSNDCAWDELCDGGSCEEIFDRRFKITVVDGEASTSTSWDAGGGAPDLFVVFGFDNDTCVTSIETDSFYPSWRESCTVVFGSGGSFVLDVYDDDVASEDLYLTFEAEGNDEVADLVREESLTIYNSALSIAVKVEPAF